MYQIGLKIGIALLTFRHKRICGSHSHWNIPSFRRADDREILSCAISGEVLGRIPSARCFPSSTSLDKSDIPVTPAKNKIRERENTFPAYASRVYSLDSFWPGTFRCQRGVIAHRRAVKRFGRTPINHESAIYRKREWFVGAPARTKLGTYKTTGTRIITDARVTRVFVAPRRNGRYAPRQLKEIATNTCFAAIDVAGAHRPPSGRPSMT